MKFRQFAGRAIFCVVGVLHVFVFFLLCLVMTVDLHLEWEWDMMTGLTLASFASSVILVRAAFSKREIDTFSVWLWVRIPLVLLLAYVLVRIAPLTYGQNTDPSAIYAATLYIATIILIGVMTPIREFFRIGQGSRYA